MLIFFYRIACLYAWLLAQLCNENILNEDVTSRFPTYLEQYTFMHKIFITLFSHNGIQNGSLKEVYLGICLILAFACAYEFFKELPFKDHSILVIYSFFTVATCVIQSVCCIQYVRFVNNHSSPIHIK